MASDGNIPSTSSSPSKPAKCPLATAVLPTSPQAWTSAAPIAELRSTLKGPVEPVLINGRASAWAIGAEAATVRLAFWVLLLLLTMTSLDCSGSMVLSWGEVILLLLVLLVLGFWLGWADSFGSILICCYLQLAFLGFYCESEVFWESWVASCLMLVKSQLVGTYTVEG